MIEDNRSTFARFRKRNEKLENQYGNDYQKKQHEKGKLTARERIDILRNNFV